MAFSRRLLLRAMWGGRPDPLEVNVDRMWECLSRVSAKGGFLGAPWQTRGRPERTVTITSRETLAAVMLRTREKGNRRNDTFTQEVFERGSHPPYADVSARLSAEHGYDTIVANYALITMETDLIESSLPEETVRWLLGIGAELVEDMVDAWQPDAASLDSTEFVGVDRQLGLRGAYPVIGYVSWLSNAVMDAGAAPAAPLRRAYRGGTLLGIDPASADPLGDATELALRVYSSGRLRTVPVVQGQSDPEPGPPVGGGR